MAKFTLMARISDGLPLAASMEEEKDHRELDAQKAQAKKIVKGLNSNSPTRMTIDAGSNHFHMINEDGVCYLCLVEKAYPKRLAFSYLKELQHEFMRQNPGKVDEASRPYAFIKFDTFIQKTKKQYVDPRNTRNMSKMNEDLADLTGIMQQNIQDVLGRGDKLESVLDKATTLRHDSSKYAKNAKYLNTQAMLRKYGPIAFVVLIVFAMLWWRFR